MTGMSSGDWRWVIEDELGSVFTKLDRLYKKDPSIVEGVGMAHVVQRLLLSEYEVGGPYKEKDGTVNPRSNAAIDQFLQRTGTLLPNLAPFRAQIIKVSTGTSSPLFTREYAAVKRAVSEQIAGVPEDLQQIAKNMFVATCKADKSREIGLISTFYACSLALPDVKKSVLTKLGVANFNVWMAYTIYDDFFDDEGSPLKLPFANFAAREGVKLYRIMFPDRDSQALIDEVFCTMDAANSWEINNARAVVQGSDIEVLTIPEYGDNIVLANRAMAHVLGPLLLALNEPSLSKAQFSNIRSAMTNYIILRQLNDDLHDWSKDLQAGHLSPVVASLLKDAQVQPGQYKLESLTAALEDYFWDSGLNRLCNQARKHAKASRQFFKNTRIFTEGSEFDRIIGRLDDALVASKDTHATNRAFLRSYKSLQSKDL